MSSPVVLGLEKLELLFNAVQCLQHSELEGLARLQWDLKDRHQIIQVIHQSIQQLHYFTYNIRTQRLSQQMLLFKHYFFFHC